MLLFVKKVAHMGFQLVYFEIFVKLFTEMNTEQTQHATVFMS